MHSSLSFLFQLLYYRKRQLIVPRWKCRRVKLTDLGLATKVTPSLHGAAGTRGYWAPEMLRRDEHGKRNNYTHMVDWFSFGCCLAEFISGTNPFRSEVALNFGLEKGKKTKVS